MDFSRVEFVDYERKKLEEAPRGNCFSFILILCSRVTSKQSRLMMYKRLNVSLIGSY